MTPISKKLFPCLLAFGLLSANSCAYSHVTRPLDTDVDETKLGAKTGRSTARSIAYLFAWGDAGVAAAAKDGNLAVVNHLDVKTLFVLFGVYTQVTTIAYGD